MRLRLETSQPHFEKKTNEAMSYFFSFPSLFTYDEKKASPVQSTEEEKFTKAVGKQNEQQEQESRDIMGSAPRKGWLDWQFWRKSDNSGGPFGAFRKNNKNPGAFAFRKDVSDAIKTKDCGKGEVSKDVALNAGRNASESGGEEGQSKTTQRITKTESSDGRKSSVRYVRIFTLKCLNVCTKSLFDTGNKAFK